MIISVETVGLRGEIPIKENAQILIQTAEKFIYIVLTPEYVENQQQFESILKFLIAKKTDWPEIPVKIIISCNPKDRTIFNCAIKVGIEIYRWKFGILVPFGKIMTEKSMIITFLGQISPSPCYNLGYQKIYLSASEILGLQHEYLWIVEHLCDK